MSSRSDVWRRLTAVTAALVALVALLACAPPAGAQQSPTPQVFANGMVNFAGHGWGHGRGMGQWGAFGYAVDLGYSYGDIVDHFYSNTSADQIPNPQITVRIVGQDGIDLVVTSDSDFTVGGVPISGFSAGHLVYRPDGKFDLYTRYGCDKPDVWYAGIVDPTAKSTIADPGNDVHKMIAVCQTDGSIREYRGSLTMTFGDGSPRTINTVLMEDYLRGVVPRESPASWGDSGNGKGMQALMAQAVAARSYSLGEGGEDGGRYSYAKTCDTTSCQVYGGAGLDGQRIEDDRTDYAVAATGGLIRRMDDGSVARTEFSSSTGGWTAGGVFPAVEDDGDGRSPFHNWNSQIAVSTVESKYGVGTLKSFTVTARNGLGEDGGRATSVQISGSSKTVTVTGNDVQAKLGLRSNWFILNNGPPPLLFFERNSNTSGAADVSVTYGQQGDIPLSCDWNGNGDTTPGVFRKGGWLLSNTNAQDSPGVFLQFGDANDIPVCGDWDGNGTQTVGVFRQGVFYLRNSNTTGVADLVFGYGNPNDQPVVGDWNADGKDSVGVYRSGVFYLTNFNQTGVADRVITFGQPGDRAIAGDWDGDGDTNIGIVRNGGFYLRSTNVSGVADTVFGFGDPGDYPLTGDWDGNGADSAGVARIAT